MTSTLATSPAAREEVLNAFFGAHNDERRAAHPTLVRLFADTGVGVLPYRRGSDERWYGFAASERSARELRGYLLAFAGPTWSTWTGPVADLDRRDPAEAVVAVAALGPVYRLAPVPGEEASLRRALKLLGDVLQRKPEVAAPTVRPRHRILADFELSLVVGQADEAQRLIDELVASGTLSAVNVLFLRLRRLAATGHYHELLEHPDLPDVLRRRRPRAVSVAIARAVQAQLVDHELAAWQGGDTQAPSRASSAFAELDAAFQTIFQDAVLARLSDVAASVALHHLLRGDGQQALNVAQVAGDPVDGFISSLIPGGQPPPSSDIAASIAAQRTMRPAPAPGTSPPATTPPADALVDAFAAGNWTLVLAHAAEHLGDAGALERVLRAAYNLDTASAAKRAIALVAAADADALAAARQDRMFRDTEQALRDVASPPTSPGETAELPQSFLDLFRLVAHQGAAPSAISAAERGRYEWSSEPLEDSDHVTSLAAAIQECAADEATHAAAVGVVAHLLDWLERGPQTADTALVVSAALDLVLYGSDASDTRDTLSMRLLEQILHARNDPDILGQRLSEFAELWLPVAAPRRLDWPLAVLDIAVDFGGQAPAVCSFFETVLNSTAPWTDRVDAAQAETLRSFARELNRVEVAAALLPTPPTDESTYGDPLARLSRKTVGIYTLTRGAGVRARDIVLSRCSGADVEVNGDTVATGKLRALAERADVMVVAYRSAQHAATDAIVAVRGRRGIVPARGKGSVALIRALENWALEV